MFSGDDAERGKLAETWALASMLQSGQGCRSAVADPGATGPSSRRHRGSWICRRPGLEP